MFFNDKRQTCLRDGKTLKVVLCTKFCPACDKQVITSALVQLMINFTCIFKVFQIALVASWLGLFCENFENTREINPYGSCPRPMRLHVHIVVVIFGINRPFARQMFRQLRMRLMSENWSFKPTYITTIKWNQQCKYLNQYFGRKSKITVTVIHIQYKYVLFLRVYRPRQSRGP